MIQVYTGNGKGKTTAALGLALRAQGAGLKVYIGQFLKRGNYSEIKALRNLKNIKVEQFGCGCFLKGRPGIKDRQSADSGFSKVKEVVSEKQFDIVILDEINTALSLGLLKLKDVVSLLKKNPKIPELILTGRNAPSIIIRMADLVSQIENKKHYYKKGLRARKGIEY